MLTKRSIGEISSGVFTFSTPKWRHFANILIFAFIAFLLFWRNIPDIDGSFESWKINLFPILAGCACLFLAFVSARAFLRRPVVVIRIDSQSFHLYSRSLQWDQVSHFEIENHVDTDFEARTSRYNILTVRSWNPDLFLSVSDFAESKDLFPQIVDFLASLLVAHAALERSGGESKLRSKLK